jgi:hypothetical protein
LGAVYQSREVPGSLLVTTRGVDNRGCQRGREKRTWSKGPSQLLEEYHEFGETVPDPAELFGYVDPEPSKSDEFLP